MSDLLIPFRVAMQHLQGVQTGDLVRYGAILKDSSTGRIVGHVQETRLLQNLAENIPSFGPIAGPASIVGIVQNAQIQSTLEAMQATLGFIQGLQIATIASSVAGLGVSAASMHQVLRRLKSMDSRLQDVAAEVRHLPSKWRELDLSTKMTRVETQVERLEEVPSRKDPTPVVRDCEAALDQGFNDVYVGVLQVVAEIRISPELLRTLLGTLALCSSAQIKALLWLDEKEVAASRARKQVRKMEELAFHMPTDVLQLRTGLTADEARGFSAEASEIRLRIASMPSLVDQLVAMNVDGRRYVEQIDADEQSPILFLPANNVGS
jgi:hypothetical protein